MQTADDTMAELSLGLSVLFSLYFCFIFIAYPKALQNSTLFIEHYLVEYTEGKKMPLHGFACVQHVIHLTILHYLSVKLCHVLLLACV